MPLNSNYGFKIMGRDGVSLNGKWPIFGFDIQNAEKAFRTTRVVDTSDHPYYTGSGVTPPPDSSLYRGFGQNTKSGYVKELITKYEHGYNYRPSGYYTVSGTFNLDCKAIVLQTGSGSYYTSWYYGDFSRDTLKNLNVSGNTDPLYPRMNDFYPLDYGLSPSLYMMNISYGVDNNLNPDILIPGGTQGNPFSGQANKSLLDSGGIAAFISVEIDTKYVYIYMNYRWYDTILRQVYWDGSSMDASIFDVQNRVKMVAETTSSVFDVNVYLTPHKLEEMIING